MAKRDELPGPRTAHERAIENLKKIFQELHDSGKTNVRFDPDEVRELAKVLGGGK